MLVSCLSIKRYLFITCDFDDDDYALGTDGDVGLGTDGDVGLGCGSSCPWLTRPVGITGRPAGLGAACPGGRPRGRTMGITAGAACLGGGPRRGKGTTRRAS